MTTRVFAERCHAPRSGLLGGTVAKLRCRQAQARRRKLIYDLNDHMLRDIGLSRGDVLSRVLLENAGGGERAIGMRASAGPIARVLASRITIALMIITLSVAMFAV
jgi:hypothetical protein